MSSPGSLHHLVWYGIQLLENENKGSGLRLTKDTVFPVGFGCKSFDDLPLSTNQFTSANIESICQIDLNTFLYATGQTNKLFCYVIKYFISITVEPNVF